MDQWDYNIGMKLTHPHKMKTYLRLLASALVIAAVGACGNGNQAPEPLAPTNASSIEIQKDQVPTSSRQNVDSSTGRGNTSNDNEKERRSIFNFSGNLEFGHLRSGGLLVDFGTDSRNKNTLGDWKTGWRGNYELDGTTISYISGTAARIYVYLHPSEVGKGKIAIRARGVGSDRAQVYLNGSSLGKATFNKQEFSHSVLEFDSGLVAGQNEILIRCNTHRRAHDGQRAALAVDYIRVIPSSSSSSVAASTYDAVRMPAPTGASDGIVMRAGESLTYYLPIPKGAAVQGTVRSNVTGQKGGLHIWAMGDDGEPITIEERVVGDKETGIAQSLSKLETQVVGIVLQATEGEVLFQNMNMAILDLPAPKAPGKPVAQNVVVVLIDTLRADHLALYNKESRVQTPYLDSVAKEMMIFDRALAQENWTKPSVATLLTGLYPQTHQTKTEKNKVPRTVSMVSESLKKMGFATAGFVANGYVSSKFGFKRGWDTWTNYVREGKPNRAQFVADDAVEWLKHRPKDKPFFLYVHTIDPHVPYIPPQKYRALYDDEPYNGAVDSRNTAKLLEKIKTGSVKLSKRDKIRLEALYDGEISYHDHHLAKIHGELDAQGLLDNTVVVITSDHGEEFFDHGSVGHGHSMYEELLHVPLIIRLPGAQPGSDEVHSPIEVGLVDVLPTVYELLGIDIPKEMEGQSLVPLLTGDTKRHAWPDASYSDFLDGQRAIRMGRYKLIYRGLRTTVFDLETDSKETTDLSDKHPMVLAALRDRLGGHQGRFVPSKSNETRSLQPERSSGSPSSTKTHRQEDAVIDAETRKQLEALGYMGD